VYRPAALSLAVGDKIRLTTGGLTKDRKHRLNNGAVYEVSAFSRNGDITLNKVLLGISWLQNLRFEAEFSA
jgi:hypothetical protein